MVKMLKKKHEWSGASLLSFPGTKPFDPHPVTAIPRALSCSCPYVASYFNPSRTLMLTPVRR